MPALKLNFPHQLGREVAQTRLRGLLDKVKARHGDKVSDLRESWAENVLNFGFRTYGFNVEGVVTVDDSEVRLDGQIPFAAVMFKGKIEQELRDTMGRVLA
jgi:hypothetical protein